MNIRIRKYKDSDVPLFYEAVKESLTALSVWMPWAHKNYSLQDSEIWIKEMAPQIWTSGKGCEFVIEDASSHKILGGCCLEQIDRNNKKANIGYWIRTSAVGKGIATQACFLLLKLGFEKLKLMEIRVIPSVENPASRKVAQKLPYESIQIVPNGFQIRDQISDAEVYSISQSSYQKTNP